MFDYLSIGARSEQIDIINNHKIGYLKDTRADLEVLAYTSNAHHYLRYANANGET